MVNKSIKIGFVGYGRMGSILGQALIDKQVVTPQHLYIFTNNPSRKNLPHGTKVCESQQELIDKVDIIFLAVRPTQVIPLIRNLKFPKNKAVVSIAVGITIKVLKQYIIGPVLRIVPSYTQITDQGLILYCHDRRSGKKLDWLIQFLNPIGSMLKVSESNIEVMTDLTSCVPAFWAMMVDAFVQEASRRGIAPGLARKVTITTLLGTANGLQNEKYPKDVIEKVATPGGITAEGLVILNKKFPKLVGELFDRTLKKYHILKSLIKRQM